MREILILSAYVLIAIILIEFFSKLAFNYFKEIRPLEYKAIKYLQTDDKSKLGKFIPTPFGLYWNAPNYFVRGIRQTNPQGYRSSSDSAFPRVTQKLRVLVLGSSTTYSDHFSLNPETSWPRILEAIFHKKGYKNVEVINAGLNYGTSAELLSHFVFHGIHLNPDILILDGPGNDFLPIANSDQTFDYSDTRISLALLRRKGEKFILRSSTIRLIYIFWVSTKHLIQLEPVGYRQETPQANFNLLNQEPEVFRANVDSLAKLSIGMKIPLILIDFLRPSEDRLKNFHPIIWQGIQSFDKKAHKIFATIASKYDLIHISQENFKFPDLAFHDACHLIDEFEFKKAEIVCDLLRANEVVSELKTSKKDPSFED